MRAGLDSHQQRLRLGDFRHFGRRRKAFERSREHVTNLICVAVRPVELRQCQRGLQFKASSALSLCDSKGGPEGLLDGGGIARIAVNEDFASEAIEGGVGPVFSNFPTDL